MVVVRALMLYYLRGLSCCFKKWGSFPRWLPSFTRRLSTFPHEPPSLGISIVGFYNAADEFVSNDVLFRHFDEGNARHIVENALGLHQSAALCGGRSICVRSPVMIIFVFQPIRVRNILICAEVVFCASGPKSRQHR